MLYSFFLRIIPFSAILFGLNLSSYSQDLNEDSLFHEPDTIIIYKDPVIIKKTFYIKPQKALEKKLKILNIEIAAGPLINFNYNAYCPSYSDYFNAVTKSTVALPGYTFNSKVGYLSNHIYFYSGLSFNVFREKFRPVTLSRPATNNIFSYLCFDLGLGYRIKKGKLSYLLTGGGILGKLISVKGETLTEHSPYQVSELTKVRKYYHSTISLTASIKILYHLKERPALVFEPFYIGDIRSIIKNPEPFITQRNSAGIKVGIIYFL